VQPRTFDDPRFHRFLWFDPISKDIALYEPARLAQLAADVHATAVHYVATAPLTGRVIYNSAFRPREPLAGDRDLLAEMVEQCHKRNIRLIAYFNNHWVSEDNLPPDVPWLTVFANGEPYRPIYGAGVCPCTNSPAFLSASLDICTELVRNYDIDGIFFDGPAFPYGTCYCEHCRRKFQELHGEPIPEEACWDKPVWHHFLQFRFQSMYEYIDTVRNAIRSVRPIPVYKNGVPLKSTWWNAINTEYLAPVSDIVGGEHFVFYSEPFNTHIFGAGATAKYHKAVAGPKPAINYLCYAHKIWDFYPLPGADMKQIIAETAANGAYPFVTVDDYLIDNDPDALKPVAEAFKLIEDNEDCFQGVSQQSVALYWSQESADYFMKGELAGAGGTHHVEVASKKQYIEEFNGFYDMLTQAHIPFDIAVRRAFDGDALLRYRCLLLPECGCLDEKQAEQIRRFVRDGGFLVASGETSLYDNHGRLRGDLLLADVLGVNTGPIADEKQLEEQWLFRTGQDYQQTYRDGTIVDDSVPAYIPAALANLKVRAAERTKVLARFMEPLPYRYHRLAGVSDNPGITLNRFGKGAALYLAGEFGALYMTYNIRHIRDIVARAIRAHVDVPLRIDGRYALEVSVARNGDRTILHLINWSARVKRPVEEITPLLDVPVAYRLGHAAASVEARVLGQTLASEETDGWVEFTVPRVDGHEIVVLTDQ
jgi:hypothetical protein